MVIDMLLIDPAASMLEDIVTHETRRINQRIAVMQTKALLAPWLDAQRHIGRCLAQTSLQSTGLLKLHSLHESSSEYVDQFVWLMVIASLLKRGHHSLEELGARIIPDECVCLVRRRFLPPNHQLTASELRMISTVIESTDLSMDHTRKLVGHPEIHLLWDPIPKEIHGPLQRFLGL